MKRNSIGVQQKGKKVKFADAEETESAFAAAGQAGDDGDDGDDDDLDYGGMNAKMAARRRRGGIKAGYTDSDESDDGRDSDGEDARRDERQAEAERETAEAETAETEAAETEAATEAFLAKAQIDAQGAEAATAGVDMEGGVRIEAFNLDEELDEGAFDANYNFVRARDAHAQHDSWLHAASVSGPAAVRRAKKASDRIRARAQAVSASAAAPPSENACWLAVLRLMRPRESVAAALKRLGGPKKIPVWKKSRNAKKGKEGDSAVPPETPEAERERTQALSELISVSDKLTGFGRYDVMEQTYESIARVLRIAELLPETWQHGDAVPSSSASSDTSTLVLWEYKVGATSDIVLGPVPPAHLSELLESSLPKSDVWVRLVSASTSLDPHKGFVPVAYVDRAMGEGAPTG